MIVVVDTNIIFSAILNTQSTIAEILLSPLKKFQFWSCQFLLLEIRKHQPKIKKISGYETEEINEVIDIVLSSLSFFDENEIPYKYRKSAYDLVFDIDPDDSPFVALNDYKNGLLWTGDKVLTDGLRRKGYTRFINTAGMLKIK